MSSSKLIRDGGLTAYERWELPSVDAGKTASSHAVEELDESTVEPMTVEQLEAIRQAAQEEGHKEGYAEGHRQGLAAAEKETRTVIRKLVKIIDSFSIPLDDLDEVVEEELVSLAMAIARQIIRRELKIDPGHVLGVVREALEALPAATRKVRIHLHPEDAQLVREALQPGTEERPWQIVEDLKLGRGDCQIQSEHSQIDASVEKRLAAISSELLGGERVSDAVVGDARKDGGHVQE